jgi:hypothetical protein
MPKGIPLKNDRQRKKHRRAKYRRYDTSPRGRYRQHKGNAKRRGVPFDLTFEQWLDVWKSSGHFDARGNKTRDGYVMARKDDRGGYTVGNVSIKSNAANTAERNRNFAYAMRAGMPWDWYKNAPHEPERQLDLSDADVPF